MTSPSPSELRCQAHALRHAAKRSDRSNVRDALVARARHLESEAEHLDRHAHPAEASRS
jgi:hypothetical protein